MLPGVDPRMMKEAMRRMGIKQTEIEASEVIIRSGEKETVISNPSVVKINMQGNISFQISGDVSERSISSEPDITEDDVETVSAQANVSKDKARELLEKNKGDLAKTIMELTQ